MASFRRYSRNAALVALAWTSSTLADVSLYHDINAYNKLTGKAGGFPSQKFRSSDIVAPVFQVNTYDEDGVDNSTHIFLGGAYGKVAGPMIFDAKDLSLVYSDQVYWNVLSSSMQTINGTKYLVFWEGERTRMHGGGNCLIFDDSYNLVYNVTAKGLPGDAIADMHELKITDQGTAIFTAYWQSNDGCNGVRNSGFQEVDLKTNEVLFTWSAWDHFNITDTYSKVWPTRKKGCINGGDFAHVNAVSKDSDGNYLVSARHLSSIALVDGRDGHLIWVLGGKRNQFTDLSDGKATGFRWQHDARFLNEKGHITLFDNHGAFSKKDPGEVAETCFPGTCDTRALHLEIDADEMTARVVNEYHHPDGINARAMGGFQTLPNGNAFVAWGYNPGFVEFKPDGTPVMNVQRGEMGIGFQRSMTAYRAWKGNWTGRPTWPPSIAVDSPYQTTKRSTVYLSWNGATDIAKWAIFASNNAVDIYHRKNLLATRDRSGFETSIYIGDKHDYNFLGAAALNENGKILGSTRVIRMVDGNLVSTPISATLERIKLRPSSPSTQEVSSHTANTPSQPQNAPSQAQNASSEGKNIRQDFSTYICAGFICLMIFILASYFWWQDVVEVYQALVKRMPKEKAPPHDEESKEPLLKA